MRPAHNDFRRAHKYDTAAMPPLSTFVAFWMLHASQGLSASTTLTCRLFALLRLHKPSLPYVRCSRTVTYTRKACSRFAPPSLPLCFSLTPVSRDKQHVGTPTGNVKSSGLRPSFFVLHGGEAVLRCCLPLERGIGVDHTTVANGRSPAPNGRGETGPKQSDCGEVSVRFEK